MKIIVASKNPVKIQAVESVFRDIVKDELEIIGVESPSLVSNQPIGEQVTLDGAINRVEYIREHYPDSDLFIGIEGGVRKLDDKYESFAWTVIMSKDRFGKARSAGYILPKEIADLLDQGLELGHATDKFFQKHNSKHKEGTVGVLSRGFVNRQYFIEQAVILAYLPFMNPDLYD